MKASSWISPYYYKKNRAGRRVKKRSITPPTNTGAYLIRERSSKKIVYVGKSHSQLKETIYRHFNRWTRPKQAPGDFGYMSYANPSRYEVRVFTTTAKQADRLELILITALRPRDNSAKIAALFDALPKTEKDLAYNDYQASRQAEKQPIDMAEDDYVPF